MSALIEQSVSGSGGGGCFRAGTQIQQAHGKTIPIQNLKVGDEVLSFDESGEIHVSKVTQVHFHEAPEPLLRVRFWRGSVCITPNHWVLNQYASFVEMGSLTDHDALIDGMGHLRPIIEAEAIEPESVWNLTVEPNHTFIADGVRVHNGGHRERFPEVSGSGGGKKKGSGGGRAAVESPDSLHSRAMVGLLDLLGEGQIGGLVDGAKSIYLDNTPLQNADGTFNFSGVTWDHRTGSQIQEPIEGFSDVESPVSDSVQVKVLTPHTITINDPEVSRVRVIVAIPSLMHQNTTTGDSYGTSVSFKFSISTDEGPFVDGETITITGKTRSQYQKHFTLTLPKPGTSWKVRMTRITADNLVSNHADDTWFDSYVKIIDSTLNYPNSALVSIRIDSSQFDRIPQRSYLVDGLIIKVPSNYNAVTRQYTGIWNGSYSLAVSDNPAWILYDVLTNERYGLGQFITPSDVDVARLYIIGKYCDELVSDGFGGMEPRFTINTAIQSQAEAYRLVSDISSVFRGMAYWAGGQVGFTQDAPTDAGMVFSQANVIDGMFNYTGSSRKDRHSVVMMAWNDPEENYKRKIEYVEDPELVAKFGIRPLSTLAFGCTSRGQANRAAKWILYTERYESDMVQFSVGLDAATVVPGEVVRIHDQYKAGKRMAGRLMACTLTSATLDAPVTLVGAGATVSIRMADGTFADRAVIEGAGSHGVLTWVSPLSELPVSNAMFIVAEASLEPMFARVIGISQDGTTASQFSITALEHLPSKFAMVESDMLLDPPVTSVLNSRFVPAPTDFVAHEAQYLVAPGVVGLRLDLSWSGSANKYEVTWNREGENYTVPVMETVASPTIDLENVRAGTHRIKIVGLNFIGARSQPLEVLYTPVGQMTAPGDVPNFQVTQRRFDLLLTWEPVVDIGAVWYEVRRGWSWDYSEVLSTQFAGTSLVDDQSTPGTYSYFIRSINADGDYSTNISLAQVTLDAPITVAGFNCIQAGDTIEFSWKANPEKNIDTYEIREGANWASGTLVAQNAGTSYSMQAGSIGGTRTFWIKAIASPGIESVLGAFSVVGIIEPTNRNVLVQIDEKATGWLGSKFNASVEGGDLVLDYGKSYGEYTFGIDLPITYHARNSIFSSFDAVFQDTENWTTATYAWSDAQSNRQWILSGDVGSVSLKYDISKFVGLGASFVEGFSLNNATGGANGTVAAEAVGITYGVGRFLKGAVINDFTRLNWNLAVPAEFSQTFWIIPSALGGDQVMWSAVTATGLKLLCGLDQANACIYLEDTKGNKITVPVWPAVNDRVLVGISQTATTRRLHVGIVNQAPQSANLAVAPLGAFTNVRLHQ